jgi:hypothetical protein
MARNFAVHTLIYTSFFCRSNLRNRNSSPNKNDLADFIRNELPLRCAPSPAAILSIRFGQVVVPGYKLSGEIHPN